MKKYAKSLTLLMSFLLAISFLSISTAGAAQQMPGELQAVADKAVNAVTNYAKKLDGAWGDQHAALVESKKGGDFEGYESMQAVLIGFLKESGAAYLYALYPSGSVDTAPFTITVDGSEDPDDYGTENEWEAGFAKAWKGTPAAGDEVWKDDDGCTLLSAYAPIRDSKGNVVAILGVDYTAP